MGSGRTAAGAVRHQRTLTDANRETPGLITAQGRRVALIDCKSRMTSRATQRHAVERAAVNAHLQLVAWTLLPVYYVFDNLDVLTPYDVLMTGRGGPRTPAGSGSPYFLVPSNRSLSFDDTFGGVEPHHGVSTAA
ncbi:hypothetical protein SO3561_07818 [Streptomyces olivochromogenes]|uniref:Uncharacterized protein n=1 Tax=Streptomyces olivochromogenes TaxID=1963 RepID=A0A250VQ23_STROL|nr:hypothetical protein SO3561_07818 [Streptomyces olivochromogenes]